VPPIDLQTLLLSLRRSPRESDPDLRLKPLDVSWPPASQRDRT